MAKPSLVWNGDKITKRMRAAQIEGVNATMSDCVTYSKRNHGWKSSEGAFLEGSIQVVEFAVEGSGGVVGRWGSTDLRYALIHELGGTITPKLKKYLMIPQEDGSFRQVKSVTIPARPYLRPSADRNYPSLADRIRDAFEQPGTADG